jgi:hypothetical protein
MEGDVHMDPMSEVGLRTKGEKTEPMSDEGPEALLVARGKF